MSDPTYKIVGEEPIPAPAPALAQPSAANFRIVGEEPIPPAVAPTPAAVRPALLSPAERTGTSYQAAPNQPTPEERLGEMVPQAAVPALSMANKVQDTLFTRPAARVAKAGGEVLEGAAARVLQPILRPELKPGAPQGDAKKAMEFYAPKTMQAFKSVGEFAGGTVGDVRNWPFFASGAARPILQKIISGGFRTMLGTSAIAGAKQLNDHWEEYSPTEREDIAIKSGLSAYFAVDANRLRPTYGGPEPAEGVLRNLLYKAGAHLPENPTEEDITAAYRSALSNIRDPRNPSNDPELVKEITIRYAEHKAARGQNQQTDTFNQPGNGTTAPAGPPDRGASALLAYSAKRHASARMVQGLPPVEPEPTPPGPVLPPDIQQGHISSDTVSGLAKLLVKLPENLRAQGIMETHETLAKVLLQQGKIVGPDGQLHIIENEKQASSVAQSIINDEVSRQEKEFARTSGEGTGKSGAAAKPVAAPKESKGVRQTRGGRAAELGQAQPAIVAEEPTPAQPIIVGEEEIPNGAERETDRLAQPETVPRAGAVAETTSGAELSERNAHPGAGGGDVSGPAAPGQGTPGSFAKGSRITIGAAGNAEAEVKHDGPIGGQRTVRVKFDEPTQLPWMTEPKSTTTIPKRYHGSLSAAGEAKVEQTAKTDIKKGEIIFGRHGATKLDQAGGKETVAGWSDESLDDRGKAAAQKMAADLKGNPPTAIVSSDLPRAKETADIVGKALSLPVKTDERLRPQRMPETEGKQVSDIQHIRDHYKAHPDEVPKGGESYNQAKERQDGALAEVEGMAGKGERPLVITHSTNLEMELGEKPEPGGIVTKNLGLKGGSSEPAKGAVFPAKRNITQHGFDHSIETGPDIGQKVRAEKPAGVPSYVKDQAGAWFSRDQKVADSFGNIRLGVDVPEDVAKATDEGLPGKSVHVLPETWASKATYLDNLPEKPAAGMVRLYRGVKDMKHVPPKPETVGTAAGAERDTAIMARLEKEHPDWSMSKPLQEAAKIANPAKSPDTAELVTRLNARDWWHVPPADKGAYAQRGKFLASSFKEAEFYGRPSDTPEKVDIQKPLVGDEAAIAKVLGIEPQHEGMNLEEIAAHDKRWHDAARDKGYDAIALMTPKDFERFRADGTVPKSIELNVLAKKEETPYKFGSTQANIPAESEAAKALETARARISKADLAGDGKDIGAGGNHVTVRYGIKDEDTEGIKKFLEGLAPFEATLGKTEKFPPSEHSEGAAVIIAPIEAPELHRINGELEKHGDFKKPDFEYKPHATIAYVKPEAADRYVGMSVTAGKKFTVSEIAISDRQGKAEVVKLEGETKPAKAKTKPAPTETKKDWASIQKSHEPPAPGHVGEMNVSDIKLAPHRFQYKLSTDAAGVSTLLKDTKVFNPELAGTISVWQDPADHKTYAINGHHRHELATRTGTKRVAVRHIVAATEAQARAIGAMQNISEGRGTAIDAAKFFRDTGATAEKLKEHGISLGEKTAAEGLAMSKLDQSIFAKVVAGDIRIGRAVAIGEATADHAEQKAILSLVERKERGGAKVSDGVLSELIRLVKGSEQATETTADLFGSQQITRSLALEKAEISDYIKSQLGKDKKLFGFVAKGDRATELERGGNKIDVEKSKEISTGAAQAEEVYNKLSARGGPISTILDQSARRLAEGDNGTTVKSEAYQAIRAEISQTLGQGLEGGSGRPEGASETSLFRQEEVAPPFYSKAARIAFDKLPTSGSGKSMLATLKNAGVKEDEMKWLGLDDLLATDDKLQKSTVLSHIMRNMVQVREISKGDAKKPLRWAEYDEAGGTHVWVTNEGGRDYQIRQPQDGSYEAMATRIGTDFKLNERFNRFGAAENWINELREERGGDTKFSSYTLPGEKRNYTEVLLTLPRPEKKVMDTIAKEKGYGGWTSALTEEQKQEVIRAFDAQPSENKFKSSHFDEPNILAHVRFDERTDAEGKPILLVEEVQSDWHQKGKRLGYTEAGLPKRVTVAEKEVEYQRAEMARKYKELTGKNGTVNNGPEQHEALTDAYRRDNDEEAGRILDALDRAVFQWQDLAGHGSGTHVPDAPFKSDWHELAMKTMLRKAAEGGYEKLAWVTGAQTAERYDLSKQVRDIQYSKLPNGNFRVWATAKDGGRRIEIGEHPAARLPDVVGKDVADQMVAGKGDEMVDINGKNPEYVISGDNLKVGGNWAAALYDRAIPNFLSKYGKKWGAKVGDADIGTAGRDLFVKQHPSGDESAGWDVIDRKTGTVVTNHYSEGAAKSYVRDFKPRPEIVHSIAVTPEMKQSVLYEGQPLFRPGNKLSSQAIGKLASSAEFSVVPAEGRIPKLLRANRPAFGIIQQAWRGPFAGVNIDPKDVPSILDGLDRLASEQSDQEASSVINKLASAISTANDSKDGVVLVPSGHSADEIRALHEELFHAAVQRRPGGGVIMHGVPWKAMQGDPGIEAMEQRIRREINHSHGYAASVVAEGMVDIVVGDAVELDPKQAEATAQAYYQALVEQHGVDYARLAQRVHDYVDQRAADAGLIKPGEQFLPDATAPARRALAAVLRKMDSPGGGEGPGSQDGGKLRGGTKSNDTLRSGGGGSRTRGVRLAGGDVVSVGASVGTVTPIHAGADAGGHISRSDSWRQYVRSMPKGGSSGTIEGRTGDPAEGPGRNQERPQVGNEELRPKEGRSQPRRATEANVPAVQPARSPGRAAERGGENLQRTWDQLGRRDRDTLFSAASPGLSDEELTEWAKSKGFRTEDAGEQLGMFGANDKLLRAFRSGPKGKEQSGLIYQSQLDQLREQQKAAPTEPFALTGGETKEEQPRLFGAGDLGEIIGPGKSAKPGTATPAAKGQENLFASDSGEANLTQIAEAAKDAAGAVKQYVSSVGHATKIARDLQRSLETLDGQGDADRIRARDVVRVLKTAGMTHADDEAIYHHRENEDEPLTENQDKWLDDIILPMLDQNEELYTEASNGGMPVENYISRSVKGKGGMLDRIAAGVKSMGAKASLSKSAPALKGRTMMALENTSRNSALPGMGPQAGDRVVVSIKNGQVTAWKNGAPENLGGISDTAEGKVFEDKDGNIWKLTQATTKEIEGATDLTYYHSALASTLTSNVQLRAAVRAKRFLEAFATKPEFKEIAWKGEGAPPKGWKTTSLPQFHGYYFEPRTAEVLDWQYDRMRSEGPGVVGRIGDFLTTAILLNPIVHPANVAASWAFEKGLTGIMPWKWYGIAKTLGQAMTDVTTKNENYTTSLEAGAGFQSQRKINAEFQKLLFEQVTEGLDKKEPWATKIAQALGIEHGNLLQLLHKPSSAITWISSDIFMSQAAHQWQAEHPGTTLEAAFKEVGRIIPEYRVPTRILDSRTLGKIFGNRLLTRFSAYHYGLLRSFAEAGRAAVGAGEPPPGQTKAEYVAQGWNRLALIPFALFLLVMADHELHEWTGDKHLKLWRPGPLGLADAIQQAAERKKSWSEVAQRVATPSPVAQIGVEALFNRELHSGRQIVDPHATFPQQGEEFGRYLVSQFGQIGQASQAHENSAQWKRFWMRQVGVGTERTAAEKMASDIASGKMGTAASDPDTMETYAVRREVLDQLRAGNSKPLNQARRKGEITLKQEVALKRRARLTELQDKVNGFSLKEILRVEQAAKKDGDKEAVKELHPIIRRKKYEMLEKMERKEVEQAEASVQ